jgi:hypothetical protein
MAETVNPCLPNFRVSIMNLSVVRVAVADRRQRSALTVSAGIRGTPAFAHGDLSPGCENLYIEIASLLLL